MGFVAYQLSLTGAAQRLSSVLPGGGVDAHGQLDPTYDVPLRAITFQSLKANTGDIFVGDTNLVSTTVHAFRVDPGDTQPPIIMGSFDLGGIKFSDYWVKGTNGEVLVVGGVLF